MKYWLLKSEPETWSWEMQKKKGAKGEPWSGVRNHIAKNNMKAMKKGDLGFFYHTGDEKAVVGIAVALGDTLTGNTVRSSARSRITSASWPGVMLPVRAASPQARAPSTVANSSTSRDRRPPSRPRCTT